MIRNTNIYIYIYILSGQFVVCAVASDSQLVLLAPLAHMLTSDTLQRTFKFRWYLYIVGISCPLFVAVSCLEPLTV